MGDASVPRAITAPAGPVGAAVAVEVSIERISHRYERVLAVDDVSLQIGGGELIALLGPSGCGKTTLLRIVAGLVSHSEGRLRFANRIVDALPPSDRGAGIVFQNYALFPHMTAAENIGYGLRARGAATSEIRATVERMLKLVQMEGFSERLPRELSGGQQQRIALARTLAVNPKVLLLDEPFGALDKNLRLDMQIEIKRIQRELGITTIMVTHDQEEALGMAERVAVMNYGRIEQFGTPEAVYHTPETMFVAGFVGSANMLNGTLRTMPNGTCVELDAGPLVPIATARPHAQDGPVTLVIRPEHLRIEHSGAKGIPAILQMAIPHGPLTIFDLSLPSGDRVKAVATGADLGMSAAPGTPVHLALTRDARVSVFPRLSP